MECGQKVKAITINHQIQDKNHSKIILFIILLCSFFWLPGCNSLHYYAQAASGQWQLIHKKKPISEIIQDHTTSPQLKQKLSIILAAREYAKEKLALKVDNAYSDYIDLKRPYVVWNIVATPEFSTEANEFCFPIAGCLRYKGYFDEAMAQRDAIALEAEGKDVYVGGVAAYSTLGWLSDPVLNTFVNRDEEWLVALIFHESTHRTLYFPGDSRFNESLATAVEQAGLKQWMEQKGNLERYTHYQTDADRQQQFIHLVSSYKEKLDQFYRSSEQLDVTTRREGKKQLFAALNVEYQKLKTSWNGYAGYDAWFNTNLNNAKISSVSTYYDLTPLFSRLLEKEMFNYDHFFKTLEPLKKFSPEQRIAQLKALTN